MKLYNSNVNNRMQMKNDIMQILQCKSNIVTMNKNLGNFLRNE